jgi:hypothetical protein
MSNIPHPHKPSDTESPPRGGPPSVQEWAIRGATPGFASSSLTYFGSPHLGAHRNGANPPQSPRHPLALVVPGLSRLWVK